MSTPAVLPAAAADALPWPMLDEQDVATHDLLADVAERCGLDAVRYLLARHTADTLSVPKRYHGPGSRLPLWLEECEREHGPELVHTIVDLRGGEAVYLPAPSGFDLAAKRRRIRAEYDGTNAGTLAERYRVARRTVVAWALARE